MYVWAWWIWSLEKKDRLGLRKEIVIVHPTIDSREWRRISFDRLRNYKFFKTSKIVRLDGQKPYKQPICVENIFSFSFIWF